MSRPSTMSTPRQAWVLAVLTVLLAFVLAGCAGGSGEASGGAEATSPEAASGSSLTATLGFAQEPPSDWSGSGIPVDGLPPEAHETLGLIATDGPYPYDQDGSTFQNREGILPHREAGFYREFTVETPGSPDRGARRLVVGDDLAAYYTEDHYDSFRFVTP